MKLIIVVSLLFYSSICFNQSIEGLVYDGKGPLEAASLLLLNQADSTMVAFTLSNTNGAYQFKSVSKGNYILQITFLGYANHWLPISIHDSSIDLDTIFLLPSSQIIPTIEVKESMLPMSVGKDTVNYNAAAYGVKPGDIAEDLLKKLPGIEIERDGSVKAFGEKVKNVFVDGKEFFGKDTKIATKNLDADAIDKVQVFDKKSDMTEFTGIEDGQEERSINLKLKDDKKVGYFGTIEAGGGTDNRFKSRANINRFTPGMRTSFIGMGNNINEQNFSISEYIDFMGGISSFMSGGSGRVSIDLNGDNGLPMGLGQNKGVQKSWASGLNIHKSFSPKTELTASFFYNDFTNLLASSTNKASYLNNNFFSTRANESQSSGSDGAALNLRLKTKIDSFQNIIFKLNASAGKNSIITDLKDETQDELLRNVNDNERIYKANSDQYQFNTNLIWQKRFRKKGRSVLVNAYAKMANNDNDGQLNSRVNIYHPLVQNILTNQQQVSGNIGMDYKGQLTLTEPLGHKKYLEFHSEWSNFHNNADADYFDFISNEYLRNELLSIAFERDYNVINNGFKLSINKKKYNYAIGLNHQNSVLKGNTGLADNEIKIKYPAFLPNAYFDYDIGQSHHLHMQYNTRIQEPQLQQLLPVVNNSDPLNIFIGNRKLKPEYVHGIDLRYMKYDAFNSTLMYGTLSFNHTINRITNQVSIDPSYRRIITPVNVKYENNINTRIEFDTPIRPIKSTFKIKLRGDISNGILFVNALANDITRFGKGYSVSIENKNKKIFDALLGFKYYRNNTTYSLSKELNQWYAEKILFTELKWSISDSWIIQSNFDFDRYTQSFAQQAIDVPLWTAGVTKLFGPQQKLRMSLNIFDLLNKNNGISRNSNLNYKEVAQSNALGQYFMLSMAYNIKGFKKKSDGVVEIKTGG